mmetsp:Transcript_42162/g.98884  ORF Transcript_42162/g.98884 Transcript_42162/m.98884 type:complete len:479 (+) Transcript_42162:228-1664(+)
MKTRVLLTAAVLAASCSRASAASLLPGFSSAPTLRNLRPTSRQHREETICPLLSVKVATKDAFLESDSQFSFTDMIQNAGRIVSTRGLPKIEDTLGLRPSGVITPLTADKQEDAIFGASKLEQLAKESDFVSVEVGHGIRCHSLTESLLEATTSEQTALQSIVSRLHDAATFSARYPDGHYDLSFTVGELSAARAEIAREYHAGEKTMAILTHLLANRFSEGAYECHSKLRAKADSGQEFTLVESVAAKDLEGGADSLAFATKHLHDVLVNTGTNGEATWGKPRMVDHSIEFESKESNPMAVHRLIGKARPYKDLWKMVSDSIFGIDHPDVDKPEFGHTNMFKIKVLVEDDYHRIGVLKYLATMVFTDRELRDHNIVVSEDARRMDLLSWSEEGLCISWQGTKIGIRVLSLDDHYEQQELSNINRKAERLNRKDNACAELEGKSRVFGFSRKLLNWIFSSADMVSPPSSEKVRVTVRL